MCEIANPCSYIWFEHFGFITIPTLAGIGFVGIITLVSLYLFGGRNDHHRPQPVVE